MSGDNSIRNPERFNVNIATSVFVRVLDSTTGCINITTLSTDSLSAPSVNLESLLFLNACSATNSTESTFDLNDIIPFAVNESTDGLDFFFYESYGNAFNDIGWIPNPTKYISDRSRDIYLRAENRSTGCFSIIRFQLHPNILLSSRVKHGSGALFDACDFENDGEEGIFLKDVKEYIANDTPNITVTFFSSETGRDAGTGALDPNTAVTLSGTNENTRFFIRISYDDPINSQVCTQLSFMDVKLNDVVEFPSIVSKDACDVVGNRQDGKTRVPFGSYIDEIRNNNSDFFVSFYLSKENVENAERNIGNNTLIEGRTITIYTRITESSTGCYSINSFVLNILDGPSIVLPKVVKLSECDDDDDPNDGKKEINLEEFGLEASLGNIDNETITYHTGLQDADMGVAALNDNPSIDLKKYQVVNGEPVYIRLVNDDTECYAIVRLDIDLSLPPTTPEESIDISECVESGDNFNFNLTNVETTNPTLANQSNLVNFLYFKTVEAADLREINQTNHIPGNQAVIYNNITNPEHLFLRVERKDNQNCYIVIPFALKVFENPTFNPIDSIEACEDSPGSGVATFSLGPLKDLIRQDPMDTVNYYSNEANAIDDNDPIELIDDSRYTSSSTMIYARITNEEGCFVTRGYSINCNTWSTD